MKHKTLVSLIGAASLVLAGCNAQDSSTDATDPGVSPTPVSPAATLTPTASPSSTPTLAPTASPSLPVFSNQANLSATALANAVRLEWQTLTNADSVTIYFANQPIDANSPAAGSQSLANGSCQTSPCILALPAGELHYVALQTKDANNTEIDFSQIMAVSGQINDSGAVRCYAPDTGIAGGFNVVDCSASAAGTTQDALIGRDASAPTKLGDGTGGFDFTKLDSAGNPITDGSAHTCVRDNLTGLVWEVKTTVNRDVRYVWGTATGSAAADVNTLVTQTNNLALCGLTNWRLPTANELFGLVDFDKPHGITLSASADGNINDYLSIDRDFFPNTRLLNYSPSSTSSHRIRHAHYWTSDTYMNQYVEEEYTLVDFFRGSLVNTANPRANFVLFSVIHDGAFARLVSTGSEGVQP